jgi:hypothetical protein
VNLRKDHYRFTYNHLSVPPVNLGRRNKKKKKAVRGVGWAALLCSAEGAKRASPASPHFNKFACGGLFYLFFFFFYKKRGVGGKEERGKRGASPRSPLLEKKKKKKKKKKVPRMRTSLGPDYIKKTKKNWWRKKQEGRAR